MASHARAQQCEDPENDPLDPDHRERKRAAHGRGATGKWRPRRNDRHAGRFVTRRASWAVGLWLCGVLACALIVWRAEFSADLSTFLPRSPSPAQQLLAEQLRNGLVSHLMLVA